MDKTHKLFVIGILIGLTVPGADKVEGLNEYLDQPINVIKIIYVAGAKLWHLAFSVMILVSLPVLIFKQLRERFSERQFLPFPFMTGNTFGFTFVTIVDLLILTP